MGAGSLVIVGGSFDLDEAYRMAVHAGDVLRAHRRVGELAEALEGCGTVVGTTARRTGDRARARDIRELATTPIAKDCLAGGPPPALVFGPERNGLSNRDLVHCHHLAYVPTATRQPSLNLAQAVLVCLYEVHRARLAAAGHASDVGVRRNDGGRATAGALEKSFRALEESLVEIGFLSAETPGRSMLALRAMLTRSEPTEREARIVRGIARKIHWYASGGREVAMGKRQRGQRLK
jgi:TrmH family RNA methyltransferase